MSCNGSDRPGPKFLGATKGRDGGYPLVGTCFFLPVNPQVHFVPSSDSSSSTYSSSSYSPFTSGCCGQVRSDREPEAVFHTLKYFLQLGIYVSSAFFCFIQEIEFSVLEDGGQNATAAVVTSGTGKVGKTFDGFVPNLCIRIKEING